MIFMQASPHIPKIQISQNRLDRYDLDRFCRLLGALGLCSWLGFNIACSAPSLGKDGSNDSAPSTASASSAQVPDQGNAMTLHRGPFSQRHLLTGELVAEEATYLIAPNTNQWPVTIRWIAEDGSDMKAGDSVVEFENSQLTSNLEDLASRLAEAENQLTLVRSRVAEDISKAWFTLQQEQANFDKAKLAAEVPDNLISRQEWESHQLDLSKAKLSLGEAKANHGSQHLAGEKAIAVQQKAVDKARRALQRSHDDLDKLELVAPRDGLVLVARNQRTARAFVSSDNAFPGTVVASMPDLSTLMVEARLHDVDDGKVRVGQRALAVFDAFPEENLHGKVRSIGDHADPESGQSMRRSFRVRIDVDGLDPQRMRPGMSMRVMLDDPPEDALRVPRAALLWDAEGRVQVQLASGQTAEVDLGPCNPTHCVVLDGPPAGTALRPARRLAP